MSPLDTCARQFPELNISAVYKSCPEDFVVDEIVAVTPSGEGEHLYVHVEKRGANTNWVARQLAKFLGVAEGSVSYAGMKDRQAITRQWFSIQLPNIEQPRWEDFTTEEYRVISASRNEKKLRRGQLQGNRFSLILRELHGDIASLEQRLIAIQQQGVPNYFMEQRFGQDGRNIEQARAMLVQGKRVHDRHKRSIYLSAARSLLFNAVVSARIQQGGLGCPMAGDVFILDGTHQFFVAEELDASLQQRISEHDIYLTAPLWGRGRSYAKAAALEFEAAVLKAYADWLNGMEHAGLEQDRREVSVLAQDMSWQFDLSQHTLCLNFDLRRGCYATAVLREIGTITAAAMDAADGD